MNNERMRIYLNDHLAVLHGARELARRCRDANDGPLAKFLDELGRDLGGEQEVLKRLLDDIDGIENLLKQGVAWLAEKAGRLKLNDTILEYSPLSRLIELDTLSAEACSRACFWQNLRAAFGEGPELAGIDAERHIKLAQSHGRKLKAFQRAAALVALATG